MRPWTCWRRSRRTRTTSRESADPLDPITFVHKIKVPVFLACQWEDEQTGGHCPALVRALHRDGQGLVHLHQRRPRRLAGSRDVQPLVRLPLALRRPPAAAAELGGDQGGRAADLPDRARRSGQRPGHASQRPDPAQAHLPGRAPGVREAAPRAGAVRQRSGPDAAVRAAPPAAGQPLSRLRALLLRLPGAGDCRAVVVPGHRAARLADQPGPAGSADRFTADPSASPATDYDGNTGTGGLWGNASQWTWDWRHRAAGSAVSYLTDPLPKDTTVLGAGAVYAWVRSSRAQRRPAGDDQRGAPGRQGDLRAERVGPR